MMKLTDDYRVLADNFMFDGQKILVDLSFDVVLKVTELMKDDSIGVDNQVSYALGLLLPFYSYDALKLEDRVALLEFVFSKFLGEFYNGDAENGDANNIFERMMDYDVDAEAIFASFFECYRVDLFEMQGKLHWRKFQAMLQFLPSESAFKEIVHYRTMEIPQKNEASDEYIRHVKKMKRLYRLDAEENQAKNDDKLSALASRF